MSPVLRTRKSLFIRIVLIASLQIALSNSCHFKDTISASPNTAILAVYGFSSQMIRQTKVQRIYGINYIML